MADTPKNIMAPRHGGTAAETRASFNTNPNLAVQVGTGAPIPSVPAAQPVVTKPDFLRGSNDQVIPNTPFTHNKNTTVSAPRTINVNFQPNILDNYDSYTYHWKLFITSLPNAANGNILSPAAQTIIAESGVSDLTLDKIEMHGIAVPSVEAGTGTQTLIKFEILEPAGAGLLDKMFYESVALGIGNWLVMPCFLQLEFRSRDPVTQEAISNDAAGELGGLRWIWPIKLTNAKANVTLVGTRYNFDAIMYDELAQSNSYFGIQHNVVLSGLSKFGQAMADLEKKLNEDQYEKLIDNYSIPDTYRIVVDADLSETLIALPDNNKNTSRGSDFIDFDKKVATYNAGTSIDKIIDSLLGSSDKESKLLQSSQTRTSEPDSADKAAPMRKLWRIVTETQPIAFDELRQDNAVKITIYVVKYDIGLIEATAAQTGQTPDTVNAARKRLATYASREILKKKYNYIFTGLNDQIVSFDLNMNFAFAATLSRFGGIFYDTASNDKGVSQQENSKNEQEAAEKVRKTLQFINNNSTNTARADIEIAAAKASIQAANIDPILKARYSKLLDKAKPADRAVFTTQIQEAGGLEADAELNRTRINATSLAANNNSNLKFISDVNISSTAATSALSVARSLKRGKLRPVPYREGMQETNLAHGIDPTSDASRSRTSNIFTTALYSSLDASLQQVKLVIKGDPFWLFPNNLPANATRLQYKATMSDGAAINMIKNGHIQSPQSVNLFGTDNFICIRFRTPRIYNETTGVNEPYSEIETFSGIYRVITIISRFEMGRFTQELSCILDNLIDLADFPEFLRQVESTNNTNATLTSTAQITDIPTTAVRIDRIPGLG